RNYNFYRPENFGSNNYDLDLINVDYSSAVSVSYTFYWPGDYCNNCVSDLLSVGYKYNVSVVYSCFLLGMIRSEF
ncbi:hypothetical protein, partial [Klebsiella pneumoniae]|uniref:hypothetical protein n=1 Tax=Klebsiella pneumoniae TaxID=573 RepID=UPI0040558EC0